MGCGLLVVGCWFWVVVVLYDQAEKGRTVQTRLGKGGNPGSNCALTTVLDAAPEVAVRVRYTKDAKTAVSFLSSSAKLERSWREAGAKVELLKSLFPSVVRAGVSKWVKWMKEPNRASQRRGAVEHGPWHGDAGLPAVGPASVRPSAPRDEPSPDRPWGSSDSLPV